MQPSFSFSFAAWSVKKSVYKKDWGSSLLLNLEKETTALIHYFEHRNKNINSSL
jgi:hypothetical protein